VLAVDYWPDLVEQRETLAALVTHDALPTRAAYFGLGAEHPHPQSIPQERLYRPRRAPARAPARPMPLYVPVVVPRPEPPAVVVPRAAETLTGPPHAGAACGFAWRAAAPPALLEIFYLRPTASERLVLIDDRVLVSMPAGTRRCVHATHNERGEYRCLEVAAPRSAYCARHNPARFSAWLFSR
jgi:hypothetical protein